MPPPTPRTDELADASSWGRRYAERDTPWDLGAPHPEWPGRLADGSLAPPRAGARAFVPGSGRGHDARFLAAAGWRVLAVDFAPEVAAEAGPALAAAGVELRIADALALGPGELGGSVELFLEHTFLCALPLERRAEWGALAERVVAPGGRLAALVFPVGKPEAEGGPPFALDVPTIARLLGPAFRLTVDAAATPAPQRRWSERFALFERAPAR